MVTISHIKGRVFAGHYSTNTLGHTLHEYHREYATLMLLLEARNTQRVFLIYSRLLPRPCSMLRVFAVVLSRLFLT